MSWLVTLWQLILSSRLVLQMTLVMASSFTLLGSSCIYPAHNPFSNPLQTSYVNALLAEGWARPHFSVGEGRGHIEGSVSVANRHQLPIEERGAEGALPEDTRDKGQKQGAADGIKLIGKM